MNLKEQIESDIKAAMKAKNQVELRALRSIKSMILLAETEKGSDHNVSDQKSNQILQKAAKQREESAQLYKEQGRTDLEEKEIQELEIIKRYLPEQMDESKIREVVSEIISATGASGMSDMGKVMGQAMQKMAGKADGKTISNIVREELSKS